MTVTFPAGVHVQHAKPGSVIFTVTRLPVPWSACVDHVSTAPQSVTGRRGWAVVVLGCLARCDYSLCFGCRAGVAVVSNVSWWHWRQRLLLEKSREHCSGLEGQELLRQPLHDSPPHRSERMADWPREQPSCWSSCGLSTFSLSRDAFLEKFCCVVASGKGTISGDYFVVKKGSNTGNSIEAILRSYAGTCEVLAHDHTVVVE
jgi:hypothetical protein